MQKKRFHSNVLQSSHSCASWAVLAADLADLADNKPIFTGLNFGHYATILLQNDHTGGSARTSAEIAAESADSDQNLLNDA